MLTPRRRTLAGLAATAGLIAAAVWLLPRLKSDEPAPANDGARPICDLNRGPCTVVLDEGRSIDFSIAPRPIPVMTPLTLQLRTAGFAAAAAEVDFTGVGMDMGYNRVALVGQADGHLTGAASLPVCSSGSMDWQAELRLTPVGSDRPLRLVFGISAPSPPVR